MPTKVPLVRSDGTVDVLGISTDIAGRVETEAALRENEQKLRMVVAAVRMGLWEWDFATDVLEWDDITCEIFGVRRETFPRDRAGLLSLIHPEDRERVGEAIAFAIRAGQYPPIEHRLVRPDGTTRHIMARATLVRAEDGGPKKFLGGVIDVTEERALEERRREAQKLAAIGQLSAGISHNFNNMLSVILGTLELALPSASPGMAELLKDAQDAALRAAEVVRELMTFAGRPRTGAKRPEDLCALVKRTLEMCTRIFDRSIDLAAEYPGGAELVMANPNELEQALLNVLINARDAVTEARVVAPTVNVAMERVAAGTAELARCGLSSEKDYVRVRIADNGIGMDDATRSRIFEPFFTTKPVGQGTGLGLSTTLTILKEHGGAIDCASTPGAGTCFSMYVPSAREATQRMAEAEGRATTKIASEAILVVDDETAVRAVVRRILEGAGYRVLLASSGEEALQILQDSALRDAIALVLLDVSMPRMSGALVREKMRELVPNLPIAYFTGYALESYDEVDGLIEKPVTRESLLNSVSDILERVTLRASHPRRP